MSVVIGVLSLLTKKINRLSTDMAIAISALRKTQGSKWGGELVSRALSVRSGIGVYGEAAMEVELEVRSVSRQG